KYEFYMIFFYIYFKLCSFFSSQPPRLLVVFDEYTIIPKILLIPLLFALKEKKISHIFIGDRAQLQAIRTNPVLKELPSSYDLVYLFVKKIIHLETNMRCPNPNHNVLLKSLASEVSEHDVSAETFLRIAIGYPKKVIYTLSKSEDYDLIHMSGKHRTVTEEINTLVSLCPDINKRFHFAKSPNDPELYHSVGYG